MVLKPIFSRFTSPPRKRGERRSNAQSCDHVIVLDEAHVRRILTDYFAYYHGSRPHLSLNRNSPTPRDVEPPLMGPVIAIAQVGGLHHRYARAA